MSNRRNIQFYYIYIYILSYKFLQENKWLKKEKNKQKKD